MQLFDINFLFLQLFYFDLFFLNVGYIINALALNILIIKIFQNHLKKSYKKYD